MYIIDEFEEELVKLIKEKVFDSLSYADKNNIKIINFKNEVNYILKDILLFNTNLNYYIPVELKLNSTNYKDVSQIQLYRKIIDNTIKKKNHNKSIGLIISKKNDNFIFKYVNDDEVYLISYDLEKVI